MDTIQDLVRSIWPEWKIVGKIGKGAFGTVYKAERSGEGVRLESAIKVIEIPSDPSQLDVLHGEGMDKVSARSYLESIVNDFSQEIQVMVALKNAPNIVAIDDFAVEKKEGTIGWTILIRMELLTPLTRYLENKRMDEAEMIRLGRDMCEALRICAERDIIHRDIKPQNVFKDQYGGFKLGDFGIARKIEHTAAGMSQKGTFSYMAPEVFNGKSYDTRADICSLGVMLYFLANGAKLPFIAQSKNMADYKYRTEALNKRMRGEKLPPPSGVSPAFARIIMKACAYKPEDRYKDAASMEMELERLRLSEQTLKQDSETVDGITGPGKTVANNGGDDTVTLAGGETPRGNLGKETVGTIREAGAERKDAGRDFDGTETAGTIREAGAGRRDAGPVPDGKKTSAWKDFLRKIRAPAMAAGGVAVVALVAILALKSIESRVGRIPETGSSDSLYVSSADADSVPSEDGDAGQAVDGDPAPVSAAAQEEAAAVTMAAPSSEESAPFSGEETPSEKTQAEKTSAGPEAQASADMYASSAGLPEPAQEEAHPVGISIRKQPDSAPRFVGDKVQTEGMELALLYSDEREETITEGFTVTPEYLTAAGNQEITVRYGDFTAVYSVKAEEVAVQSVKVSTQPDKAVYYVGEAFQPKGMELTAVCNNGDVRTVSEGFRYEPEKLSKAGEQQITVIYDNAKTTCKVTVRGADYILKENDPTDKTEEDARKYLEKYGLVVSVELEAADGAHTGKVLSAKATSDGSVTLAVGKLTEFSFTENNGTITVTGVSRITDLLDIPDRINGLPVTEIGPMAFNEWDSDGDTGIDSVRFPAGLVRIGEGAFYGCRYLSKVTFPGTLTEIADHAFSYCGALTKVDFGNVETIGDYAFQYCRLNTIEIPDTCRRIGAESFIAISAAGRIYLPASLTEIGPGAFTGCSNAEFEAAPGSFAERYLADSGL